MFIGDVFFSTFAICKLVPDNMTTFEQAIDIILSCPPTGKTEHVGFMESVGRVLASEVVSDINMPPFNKAAMDGYACRSVDLPGPFSILEEIPAGIIPGHSIFSGTCSRIMTGAPVPEGADCIMMQEHVTINTDGKVVFSGDQKRSNICYMGEDVRIGDILISRGTLIRPEHIAIMASAGATEVVVSSLPRIAVFSTGNELAEPWEVPSGAMIRNSNGYQITAQLKQCMFDTRYLGIISDNPKATLKAILKGFETSDIVVLTGGVSEGTYDFVPHVMLDAGVEILFHHLAVQPGKPSLFGRRDDKKYIFGLPGNPVSSFIQTELLVKLLCYRLQGHHHKPPLIRLPMGTDLTRKRTERKSFVPVRIEDGRIYPVNYHGSAHIQSLNGSHGIITLEPGIKQLAEGEPANVRLL